MRKKSYLLILFLIISAGLGLLFWLTTEHHPAKAIHEQKRFENLDLALSLPKSWTGDLDGMLERRLVRILVPYSKTFYFLDRGQARGAVHDAGMELQKWLNRKYGSKTLPIRVIFIPTSRQHFFQELLDGNGDIIAGNLTITPMRQKQVDFTDPITHDINELVITGPASTNLRTIEDLAKETIYVRQSSSYYEHLQNLSNQRNLNLNIVPADEALEDEDLLEMVNAGLLPLAIVDSHKAAFWAQILSDITIREDLVVNQGGKIAWAIRKKSPKLLAELNAFIRSEGSQKGLANMLLKRYLVSTQPLSRATDEIELEKFDSLQDLFRKYAEIYKLDNLLLLAQGYQESRLDQSTRSRAGAVGIMQILPSTAASEHIKIKHIDTDVEQNIHAGAKYMRHLLDTYLSDPGMDQKNQLLLGLAMYNAGPGNVQKMRRQAVAMGLDQNIWFNNVEHAAAQLIGRETVQYVSNIYKYYLSYRLVEERRKALHRTKQ